MDRSKDVTRRLGWKNLKAGDHFMAVEKSMGLKKGEKINPICELVCVSERWEPLRSLINDIEYGKSECIREGFSNFDPYGFGIFFIRTHGLGWNGENYSKAWDTLIHRIEFAYVGPASEVCNHGD
jgi:hypothetical protein